MFVDEKTANKFMYILYLQLGYKRDTVYGRIREFRVFIQRKQKNIAQENRIRGKVHRKTGYK